MQSYIWITTRSARSAQHQCSAPCRDDPVYDFGGDAVRRQKLRRRSRLHRRSRERTARDRRSAPWSAKPRHPQPPVPAARSAELAKAFTAFMTALRAELGLGPTHGSSRSTARACGVATRRLAAFMPPLMVSVWDTQTRLAIAQTPRPAATRSAQPRSCCASMSQSLHGHRATPCIVIRHGASHHDAKAHTLSVSRPITARSTPPPSAPSRTPSATRPRSPARAPHGRIERRRASVLRRRSRSPRFPISRPWSYRSRTHRNHGESATDTRYIALSRTLNRTNGRSHAHSLGHRNHLHWFSMS